MIRHDCHIHTNYSPDSNAPMEKMAARAAEIGLSEIAFTDHADYLYPSASFHTPIDFERYKAEIAEVRERYRAKINIAFGIEIGVVPELSQSISSFVKTHQFDFVIGSLHDYKGTDFYFPDFYEGKTKRQAYTLYFQEQIDAVKEIDAFHVLGHMDYIARYGRYADKSLSYAGFAGIIDELLKTLVQRGKGIEINTSGLRYNLGHAHPQFEIVKRYRELGGEIITVGSDAHKPEHIASDFGAAYEYLKSAGFKAVTVFHSGRPYFVDI